MRFLRQRASLKVARPLRNLYFHRVGNYVFPFHRQTTWRVIFPHTHTAEQRLIAISTKLV